MLRRIVLPTLMGLAACTHARGRPAVAPAPLQPAAAPRTAPATAPPAAPTARGDSAHAAAAPNPAAPISPATPVPPPSQLRDTVAEDSTGEEAFLDTLRALSFDSAAHLRPAAPGGAGRAEAAPPDPIPSAAQPPMFDIDVANYAANERVQYYLDYFRGRAREHFALYLARLGRYDGMLRARLRAAGLPQDLEYMALIESGMNPNAVSRRRAVGLWQFMAWTGKKYGLAVDPWVDERRDPWRATDAAIQMISELNEQFGSLYLAAAAYDAGPGKIQRGLARFDLGGHEGNDLFFALAEERFLRRETRDYVPKLIAAAMIAKEPEKWGFLNIERWQPLVFDSIRVPDAVGLDVLARLADTTQEALEELNPQLVRRVTPPGRAVWVRVPAGKADSTVARLAVLPPGRRVTHREHYVSRGETLGGIALRYRVSVEDILGANRTVRPRALQVGQRLVIPTAGVPSASRATYAAAEPRRAPAARAAPTRYLLSTAARLPAAGARRVHVVRAGENPWVIARRFQVKLAELLRENGLTKRSLIKPGQTLRIPG